MAVIHEPNYLNVETIAAAAVYAMWHRLCVHEGRMPCGIFIESKIPHIKYFRIDFLFIFFTHSPIDIIKTDLLWVSIKPSDVLFVSEKKE